MLTGIIAVVLGLGLMILIHEFGHFLTAKICINKKREVNVCAVGFGYFEYSNFSEFLNFSLTSTFFDVSSPM